MKTCKLVWMLEVVKEKLITDTSSRFIEGGICRVILTLRVDGEITPEEHNFMLDFLRENKPSKNNDYSEFTDSLYWSNDYIWWDAISDISETRQIRIDYLTKLTNNIICSQQDKSKSLQTLELNLN